MMRYIVLASVIILGAAALIFMNAEAGKEIEATTLTETELDVVPDAAAESEVDISRLSVSFSHTETFYDTAIDITLFSDDPNAIIFFTTDGSPPSQFSRVYTAPIRISAGDRIRATTIKAVAVYYENESCAGIESAVATNSYITGRNVWSRFTPETYVFVLSADPYDLYDYYHGIAVEGFLRDEYIENERGGRRGNIDPPAPANFNIRGREGERDFYVEVYDYQGNTLIHQAAGGRIQGGWSRAAAQKSWRLIARSQYGESKFRHAFFDDTFNYNGQLITRFDRLILRNGANDREHANIRDELGGSLAKQAGFPDVQAFAPAAVFLNGEYYGFAWLKESMCLGYLAGKYGGLKENYEIIQKSESGEDGEERAVEDWAYVYELAKAAAEMGGGFRDDAVFEEFCSLVDIENLIMYYAIQTYIDNRDWPGNNVRLWRYFPDDDEVIASPFNDGKWRFLMYDVEFSMGIYGQGNSANTLSHMLGGRGSGAHMGGQSVLLQAVLGRDDMREKYANTICDLIDGAFSTSNMTATLEEIAAKGDPELLSAVQERVIWLWDLHGNREQINSFARRRPQIFLSNMVNIFELPDDSMYTVTLTDAAGACAWLNTRMVSENDTPVTTNYFTYYGVPLSVQPYAGYEFVRWEVNGTHYLEPEMRITADMADESGNISIKLHTDKVIDGAPLFINELCTANGADWISLYNPNRVAISTRTYYLSDDIENLMKWKIPAISIQPEESLTIVMKNNSSPDTLMKPQANFSLSAGETLFLSDANGEIIAKVDIPEVERGGILTRERDGTYSITGQQG